MGWILRAETTGIGVGFIIRVALALCSFLRRVLMYMTGRLQYYSLLSQYCLYILIFVADFWINREVWPESAEKKKVSFADLMHLGFRV
jgi:hypothetical protein